jgi:hypothetical protein
MKLIPKIVIAVLYVLISAIMMTFVPGVNLLFIIGGVIIGFTLPNW